MKVIFLKDVPRVGKRHDIKDVNDGYAANFLFPRNLAVRATSNAIAQLESQQKEIVIKKEIQDGLLNKNLEEIKGKIITLKASSDNKGHLFSSIHKKDIVEEMKKEHRVEISEDSIILEKPIKEIGDFEIEVSIKSKKSSFKLIVKKRAVN